jgi:tetratricopeptide (TPR) repeat protein
MVTRVVVDDQESLADYLVRKELLLPSELRAAMADVEHLDITLAQAFEQRGLLNRLVLDEIRAQRTRHFLQLVVAEGARVLELEARPPDEAPPVDLVGPVFEGLLSQPATRDWHETNADVVGPLCRTTTAKRLEQELQGLADETVWPLPDEDLAAIRERLEAEPLVQVGALIIMGLLEVRDPNRATPEQLEAAASGNLSAEEACRLLLAASELYEHQGDEAEARRAALSALRRCPTAAAPLTQIEELCVACRDAASLDLVYELVLRAMPGPHCRRAVLYRAAKLFERRLEDLHKAREYYERSLVQVPESGAVLDAVKRTCVATGQLAALADAFTAVGQATAHPLRREAWLRQAIQYARQAGDEKRTFDLLAHLELLQEDSVATEAAPPPVPPPSATPKKRRERPSEMETAYHQLDFLEESTSELSLDDLVPDEDVEMIEDDRVSPSTPVPNPEAGRAEPHGVREETEASGPSLEEACGALAFSPAEAELLADLEKALAAEPQSQAAAGVDAFLALFREGSRHVTLGDTTMLQPFSTETIAELASLPQGNVAQALALLWRDAPLTVASNLSDLGIGRAIPQNPGQPSAATRAFDIACHLLPVEPPRLLHQPSGPAAQLVLSRPLALLTGPTGQDDSPEMRFALTKELATSHARLIVPMLMSEQELAIMMEALRAAFGPSPRRGSLDPHTASLVQDLWTALPEKTQASLRKILAEPDEPEQDAAGLQQEATSAAFAMALLVTGDIRAALRTAVAEDPFLAGTDPTTREGYARAAERSDIVADLVRMALWPSYWALRLGTNVSEP